MKIKDIMILGSLATSLITTSNVVSAEGDDYSIIVSKYKEGFGENKCLRTFSDNNSVSIGKCSAQGGTTDDASMRQWQAVEQSNGFFLLKNKYKNDVNKGQCLRTFSGRGELEVGDCNAQGGATDYNSMRLWEIVEKDNYVLLKNKYKQDAGKVNCIRTFNKNSSTLIGDCNAQGGASDYTSMRQWKSDAFPFKRPWGPTGIVSVKYSFPNAPKSGFDSISFPINIEKSPEARGYYYAMQYRFINGNLGYIGLQPRDIDSGLAIFSVFGSGVKPVASHCTGSADGGEGSSCSKAISIVFGHNYNLTVKRDDVNNKVWRGYVEDTVTGEINEIGAWQPRDGSEGLNNSSSGFVEYYPIINSCTKIPYTKVSFGSPVANEDVDGTLKKPFTYGKCRESVNFSTEEKSGEWDITLEGVK